MLRYFSPLKSSKRLDVEETEKVLPTVELVGEVQARKMVDIRISGRGSGIVQYASKFTCEHRGGTGKYASFCGLQFA